MKVRQAHPPFHSSADQKPALVGKTERIVAVCTMALAEVNRSGHHLTDMLGHFQIEAGQGDVFFLCAQHFQLAHA